ncbi:hypothetical protein SS50377_27589 [Spironucleus salmonicida]|nr:hypothetical protein SS50377_27589 [Spironucleus salmonicida]
MQIENCYKNNFTQSNPSINQAAINILLTNKGLEKYGMASVDEQIEKILTVMRLPKINLDIMGVSIDIDNGIFTSLQIKEMDSFIFNESISFQIKNMSLEIHFEVYISQKQFPFLQDTGQIIIQMENIDLSTIVRIESEDECKNKFKPYLKQTLINIKKFQFTFNCNLQIIINMISQLLQNQISQLINGILGEQIAQEIMLNLMESFIFQNEIIQNNMSSTIVTDQRLINGIQINGQFMVVSITGQRCIYIDNQCYNSFKYQLSNKQQYYTNNDIQYQIEKAAFNSGFDLWLHTTQKVNNDIIIKNIKLIQFHNTGAEIQLNILIKGIEKQLVFLDLIKFSQTTGNGGIFRIKLSNLIKNEGNVNSSEIAEIIQFFETSFEQYNLQVSKTNYLNQDSQLVVYLDANWVHFGIDMK